MSSRAAGIWSPRVPDKPFFVTRLWFPGTRPDHKGQDTHVASVAGVQLWSCRSFAADDIFSLLHLKAAVIQGLVQLSDLWLEGAGIPCRVNHKNFYKLGKLDIQDVYSLQVKPYRNGTCGGDYKASSDLTCSWVRSLNDQSNERVWPRGLADWMSQWVLAACVSPLSSSWSPKLLSENVRWCLLLSSNQKEIISHAPSAVTYQVEKDTHTLLFFSSSS